MTFIHGLLIGGAIAFIAGIFVYRNNQKMFGKYADKIDDLHDKLEQEAKKKKK